MEPRDDSKLVAMISLRDLRVNYGEREILHGLTFEVMRGAVTRGLVGDLKSASGLVGGDAAKLRTGPAGPLSGTPFRDVLSRALAVRQKVTASISRTTPARVCTRSRS